MDIFIIGYLILTSLILDIAILLHEEKLLPTFQQLQQKIEMINFVHFRVLKCFKQFVKSKQKRTMELVSNGDILLNYYNSQVLKNQSNCCLDTIAKT